MRDDLAVILAGQAERLRNLLYAAPPLAARFRAVANFPGYTPAQLGSIFAILADEAGLSLTPEAERAAAALLAQAEADRACQNARLAVRLLTQVTAAQARRVTASAEAPPTRAEHGHRTRHSPTPRPRRSAFRRRLVGPVSVAAHGPSGRTSAAAMARSQPRESSRAAFLNACQASTRAPATSADAMVMASVMRT